MIATILWYLGVAFFIAVGIGIALFIWMLYLTVIWEAEAEDLEDSHRA